MSSVLRGIWQSLLPVSSMYPALSVVWNFVEGGLLSAVCVVAAFFVFVAALRVGFSRVDLRLAVPIVGLAVGCIVDARGVCGCGTHTCFFILSA